MIAVSSAVSCGFRIGFTSTSTLAAPAGIVATPVKAT